MEGKRTGNGKGHRGAIHGNAHRRRAERRTHELRPAHATFHGTRNGNRPHGPRPQNLGAECAQPDARCKKCVHHRRFVHGLLVVRQPVHHLHGPHRPRLRICGKRNAEGNSVKPIGSRLRASETRIPATPIANRGERWDSRYPVSDSAFFHHIQLSRCSLV